MKTWKAALISFAVVLAVGIAALVVVRYVLFTRPFAMAKSNIPQNGAELVKNADGTLTLSWPEADKADDYLVELWDESGEIWSEYAESTSCEMPMDINANGDVVLYVYPRAMYETPNGEFYRRCERPLTASYPAVLPSFDGLSTDVDSDKDILTMTWNAVKGGVYTVCDENGTELVKTDKGGVGIPFGVSGPIPAKDEMVRFTLKCGLEGFDVAFNGGDTATVEMSGELLRDTAVKTDIRDLGNNLYGLEWNETRGDRYEVFVREGDKDWSKVGTYTDSGGRSCVLGPLEPFETYGIRVMALGGSMADENESAATAFEASVTTGVSTLYATVWVLKDLNIWSDTGMSEKTGVATTDRSYCVMGEKDGFFLVYTDGAKGWIDSTYCLINLPDYMGDLAEYDIKNSYDSIYTVNDYGIPGITGTVITGYEEVGLVYGAVIHEETVRSEEYDSQAGIYDGPYEMKNVERSEPSDFLVPLLYPTAKKVVDAALTARRDGYRLKIYDAYRPYIATRFLYDLTETVLQDEVPEYQYRNMAGEQWEDYLKSLETPEEEPDINDSEQLEGMETPDTETTGGDTQTPEEPETREPRSSYYTVMTDGRYSLSAFLARSGSMHNLGVAVDLTMTSLETGEEMTMQTSMHDLSWHSVLGRNNENADLLAKYMTGANLGPLSSEWWHFQDDELRSTVKDLTRRQQGVTRAGWMFDGTGWRFRNSEGEFLKNGTFAVNGHSYTFDSSGYGDYARWEESRDS